MHRNTLIIMSDNRPLSDHNQFNSLTSAINYTYSISQGYDFRYYRPHCDFDFSTYNCRSLSGSKRHAAWSKLLSCVISLESSYDTIVYIDSDCVFLDHTLSIDNYIINSKKVHNAPNPEIIFLNNIPWNREMPCSGFFIFKNSNISRDIFHDWYIEESHFHNINHMWEQHALQNKIINNSRHVITIIDDMMFEDRRGQFLRHVGSKDVNYDRVKVFTNIAKKIGILINLEKIIDNINIIEYNTQEITQRIKSS